MRACAQNIFLLFQWEFLKYILKYESFVSKILHVNKNIRKITLQRKRFWHETNT